MSAQESTLWKKMLRTVDVERKGAVMNVECVESSDETKERINSRGNVR